MKVNKVSFSYKATVQMRQFEPVIVYGAVESQVDPSDDPGDVIDFTRHLAENSIKEAVTELKKQRKRSHDDDDPYEKNQ